MTEQQKATLKTAARATALKSIVRSEGLEVVLEELRAIYAESRKEEVAVELSTAVALTVSDWPAVRATIDTVSSSTLYPLVRAIKEAIEDEDVVALGPLFFALYGAEKAHRAI